MAMQQFGKDGWTPARISSLVGKTFVITGANSGAGFEASKILLAKGARVVMLNRNRHKTEQAIAELKQTLGEQIEVLFIQLDLSELASVRQAATALLEQVPAIDALICNGAIAQVPEQKMTVDGFESQLGVNHFGHFLLTGLLFERIEQSQGRVVIVGSNAYKMGLKRIKFEDLNFDQNYSAWDSYAQSKLAQMMFGYELQRRIQAAGKKVAVYICHPGASRTNLLMDTASTFNKLLWSVLSRIIAQSAERGAWPEVMCATEQELQPAKLYGPTKRANTVGPVAENELDAVALDQEMAAKLWNISLEKTALTWQV